MENYENEPGLFDDLPPEPPDEPPEEPPEEPPDPPDQLPIVIPGARTDDYWTSHVAWGLIRGNVGNIQRAVLDAYARHPPMTARTAELLPEFKSYGYSTIRKRISELWRKKILVTYGTDFSSRAPRTIYALPPKPDPRENDPLASKNGDPSGDNLEKDGEVFIDGQS